MPPPRKMRMTDFARARLAELVAAFSAANKFPSDNPNGASAPTRMKSRRDQPLQKLLFFPLNETSSIVSLSLMVEGEVLRVEQRPEQIAMYFFAQVAARQ